MFKLPYDFHQYSPSKIKFGLPVTPRYIEIVDSYSSFMFKLPYDFYQYSLSKINFGSGLNQHIPNSYTSCLMNLSHKF